MRTRSLFIGFGLGALAATANAQIQLDVDSGLSDVGAEVCVQSTFGDRCDTDSTSLDGTVDIALDSYSAPTQISIYDLHLETSSNLSYNFSYGFFGSVSATITGFTADYQTPGTPTGPVAVDGSGNFLFPAVAVLLNGTISYTSSGAIGLIVGSGTSNLADQGPQSGEVSGIVTTDGTNVSAASSLTFLAMGEIVPGVTTTIDATATLVASGLAPPACLADWNNNGIVDTSDFLAYLNDYNAVLGGGSFTHNDPDLAAPIGVLNTSDFIAFLNIFNAGCP